MLTGIGPVVDLLSGLAIIFGFFWWAIQLTIKASLADFLKEINGTYRRREECELISGDMERRLVQLENRKH